MTLSFYTARALAELGLPALPGTERAIQLRAQRDQWPYRQRQGRGGGKEYPVDALPAEARAELEARARREAASSAIAETAAVQRRQIATVSSTDLTGRQRQVMEARAAILLEIDRRVLAEGATVTAAIRAVAKESAAGTLPADLQALVTVANDRSGGTARVSERALFMWRAGRDASGVTALAPKITRQPAPLPEWFREFLSYYATPQKRTITHALDMWGRNAPGIELPSYDQVRLALGKLGAVERHRGRMGALALKSLQAYRARDTSELLPTSVYVADGKTFDAEVAHPIHGQPFRPELTSIIDANTRRLVGLSAALDESAHAVLDALRLACTRAGIPALFYTDRGPGYRNGAMDKPLTGFLSRLDITPMRALPYNSQAKGIVERLNHVWSILAREMPTYISRDMDKEAKQAIHKRTRRDLALVGTSRLLPAWDDFLRAIVDAAARYNDTPHSSLPKIRDVDTGKFRHMSPNEAWAAACDRGFEPILVAPEEAEDLFRPWVVRKARRCLVEWLTNEYFAAELEQHHGRDVIVGYDIHDASRVWVREIDLVDGERCPGRLIAIAKFAGNKTRYVPLSAEQDAIERRARGQRRRLEKKIAVVEAQLRPSALLEASREEPISIVPTATPERAQTEAPAARLRPDGRPYFDTDVEFARWIAAHPEAVTSADREYLREEVLATHTSKELLRMSGVDLEALRAIAKSAA